MFKRLAAVVLSAAVMMTTAVFAAGVSGIISGDSITIVTNDKDRLILNGYDENGRLSVSRLFTSEDGTFGGIPSELAKYRLRASFLDGEVSDVTVTAEPASTDAPVATAEPEATAEPTSTPTQKYPSVYDKQIDAVDAIAVINKVSIGQNDNSEMYYYVDALYQGEEVSLGIEESVTVTAASDEFSYMDGQKMNALKKGDVVCFTANLSGKIKGVGFVYRPLEKNIATDGNDYGSSFEKLISYNGAIAERSDWSVMRYGGGRGTRSAVAFGVIRDKTSSSVTLLGPDGDESKALSVDLKNDTIVYVCDMASRKELSIEGISSISKSSIPKSAEDENGNVIYSDDYTMNYALLRVVDGTVTDAVVYINYN